ncbi:hypothetical protein [Amycolatopsis anabasis]|uniref:hypothetical protein n=1 Tax=Amycolatopsis anabasis TaxID=1840409 RepID=UPI00131B6CC0|nr:hypothetical protein [Amycolatopsis anabasis]
MASQIGVPQRAKHFVPQSTPAETDHDGWPVGYLADCGELCIPADKRYLAGLPFCALCKARHLNAAGEPN